MKMKIKEIGQLFGGQVINRVEAKNVDEKIGDVKILVPKAIKNGSINHNDLSEISIKTKIDENKLTKAGDIIIKLSQPYDAAYISEKDEGILITSFCLLLRNISPNINPKYLVSLINSEVYKEQAMMATSGATVPMLTKSKIENIKLNIRTLDEQEKIVKICDEIRKKEEIFSEIIMLEKLKLENILRGENNE